MIIINELLLDIKIYLLVIIVFYILLKVKKYIDICKCYKNNRSYKEDSLIKKGQEGEVKVLNILDKFLLGGRLFHNVYIPIGNGKRTGIDLILVNYYGIFVIESKNWTGSVIGLENDEKWIQEIDGNTYYRVNPCTQNDAHIKYLRRYLGVDRPIYYSIVVFGKESILVNKDKYGGYNSVINLDELEGEMSLLTNSELLFSYY